MDKKRSEQAFDPVERPKHYNVHPSGIECIELAELFPFCLGNTIKYCWRMGLKAERATDLQDLGKAEWYLKRQIEYNRLHEDSVGIAQPAKALQDARVALVERIVAHHPEHIQDVLRALVNAENCGRRLTRAVALHAALDSLQRFIAERKASHATEKSA